MSTRGVDEGKGIYDLVLKGDTIVPGTHRGITLLNTIGKTVFCKLLNDRIDVVLEKKSRIRESQAGFRRNSGYVDHLYTLGRSIQGRSRAGLQACFFFSWMCRKRMA